MFVQGTIYSRVSLHDRHGGQRQGGISTPRDRPLILLFTGAQGQRYGYFDRWTDEGIFLFTGEGQTGDMSFRAGNRAIRDHVQDGKDLHLFEYVARVRCRYLGQMICSGYHFEERHDRDGTQRRGIVFELTPLATFYDWKPESPASAESPLRLREVAMHAATHGSTPLERQVSVLGRSDAVRRYALARADGVCELCNAPAPFITDEERPYLEVHHLRRLSDGGPDEPPWVAALCPNCHRRVHHGRDRQQKNEQLRLIVDSKESRYH